MLMGFIIWSKQSVSYTLDDWRGICNHSNHGNLQYSY